MMRGLIALAFLAAAPAAARTLPVPSAPASVTADPAATSRVNELVGVIAGTGNYDGYFSPGFRTAVPKDKWDSVVAQVTAQVGKPIGIASFAASNPWAGVARVQFERGIVMVQLTVDPAAPHQVIGLYFTGTEVTGDTFDKLTADFRALPGTGGLGVYLLGGGAPKLVAGVNPDQAAPLGSAFKLWVLGELSREVAAGEHKWADVVPLGPPSLPSGMTQSWPAGGPITLHTLATLMISISDNTATDTLVTFEGRKLDAFVAAAGTPGLAPMLTTRQMFALKSGGNADFIANWGKANAAARRTMLDADAARLAATPVDTAMFSGKPVAIDSLEWFASPRDTAGVFDWLRTKGGDTALALLTINPGTDPVTRARFDYVGFKGGSEPGVLTLNYLVRRKDGRWLAIVGNWHRADAGVELATFTQLMSRALVLTNDAKLP